MRQNPDIALFGIGGYANIYVRALLDRLNAARDGGSPAPFRLVAAADPNPSSCLHLADLGAHGVPIYPTPEALLAAHRPGLTVISSPIPFHHDHILACLAAGSHVLCEKPLCATLGQARNLLDASRRHRRHVAVGFQWSFGAGIQSLKSDIRRGIFGRPRRFRTLVLWPRADSYYTRNAWAGRTHDELGRPVFDSPVSNACAHFLHNMLYVLGDAPGRSALPTRVTAELYRSKQIQSYDTAALRCHTRDGVEILFYVSHATRHDLGPTFEYEFDDAIVTYEERPASSKSPTSSPFAVTTASSDDPHVIARFRDGRVIDYGPPPAANEASKLFATLAAIRDGTPSLCGVEAALPHMAVTMAAQLDPHAITDFPYDMIIRDGSGNTATSWVTGLDAALERCYRLGLLPSELALPWSRPARETLIGDDLSLTTTPSLPTTPLLPTAPPPIPAPPSPPARPHTPLTTTVHTTPTPPTPILPAIAHAG